MEQKLNLKQEVVTFMNRENTWQNSVAAYIVKADAEDLAKLPTPLQRLY